MRLATASAAATLLALAALAATALGSGSGVRVRVVSSPTCPVERVPPDPACAPRPFAASVRVYRLSDGHTVTRLHTGSDGIARLRLRPGRYGLSARPESGARLPRCPGTVRARVRTSAFARVTIDCDSGIR
jgi:hypothetical protein